MIEKILWWIRPIHEECKRVKHQRDVLYYCIRDWAKNWKPYHGSAQKWSDGYCVCEEIRKELDGNRKTN